MTKEAYDKIAEGLREVLDIAKSQPVCFETVHNARIDGLTVSGALLISAAGSGGFRIEVDDESLLRFRHMIDLLFSQDRSTPPSQQEPASI